MPLISLEGAAQYWEPQAVGPVAMNYPPVTGAPASLAANASYSTNALTSDGFKLLTVAAEMSAAATLTVQRYIDLQGTIPQGAPSTLALSANTLGVINIGDGLPFGSYKVTIANGGSAGNLSTYVILQTAA